MMADIACPPINIIFAISLLSLSYQENASYDIRISLMRTIKLVVIGSSGVGKTSLRNQVRLRLLLAG